jgi:hypothetical protein
LQTSGKPWLASKTVHSVSVCVCACVCMCVYMCVCVCVCHSLCISCKFWFTFLLTHAMPVPAGVWSTTAGEMIHLLRGVHKYALSLPTARFRWKQACSLHALCVVRFAITKIRYFLDVDTVITGTLCKKNLITLSRFWNSIYLLSFLQRAKMARCDSGLGRKVRRISFLCHAWRRRERST